LTFEERYLRYAARQYGAIANPFTAPKDAPILAEYNRAEHGRVNAEKRVKRKYTIDPKKARARAKKAIATRWSKTKVATT
jgi:hypothetical protein